MIRLEPSHYITDTLHLRIRILEKVFYSVFSTIISLKKSDASKTIDEFNDELNINNIPGRIVSEKLSENHIKYKIKDLNLSSKMKSLDFIISYIEEKYSYFHSTKLLVDLWKVINCIYIY